MLTLLTDAAMVLSGIVIGGWAAPLLTLVFNNLKTGLTKDDGNYLIFWGTILLSLEAFTLLLFANNTHILLHYAIMGIAFVLSSIFCIIMSISLRRTKNEIQA